VRSAISRLTTKPLKTEGHSQRVPRQEAPQVRPEERPVKVPSLQALFLPCPKATYHPPGFIPDAKVIMHGEV